MRSVLAEFLMGCRSLSELVGVNIDWDVSPQGTSGPRIVMQVISDPRRYTMSGPIKFYSTSVQINCIAASAEERSKLASALDAFLSGYRGAFNGVMFLGVFAAGYRERFDHEGPSRVFTAQADYLFHWAPAQG